MNRRDALLALAAVGATALARAQTGGRMLRLAQIWVAPEAAVRPYQNAFLEGLRSLGYERGRNLVQDVRHADGKFERVASLVDELAAGAPDLYVGIGQLMPSILGRTKATPIVMITGADPVEQGWAKSLARPGGRLTGITSLINPITGKMVELLADAVPALTRVTLLNDKSSAIWRSVDSVFEAAARAKRLDYSLHYATGREETEAAMAAIGRARPGGLVVNATGGTNAQRGIISDAALRLRIPVISNFDGLTEAGALMSYSASFLAMWRDAARFVDRIAKGTPPGEIPIEQPTKFELVINLKTARAIGFTVPPLFVARADRVIE